MAIVPAKWSIQYCKISLLVSLPHPSHPFLISPFFSTLSLCIIFYLSFLTIGRYHSDQSKGTNEYIRSGDSYWPAVYLYRISPRYWEREERIKKVVERERETKRGRESDVNEMLISDPGVHQDDYDFLIQLLSKNRTPTITEEVDYVSTTLSSPLPLPSTLFITCDPLLYICRW